MNTVTIYDGNPSESGLSPWPDVYHTTSDTLSAAARRRIVRAARKCGEYERNQKLWWIIRRPDGASLSDGRIVI